MSATEITQETRQRLLPSEAVALARQIEPTIRAAARARQAHGNTAPGRRKAHAGAEPLTTRDALAERCGYSPHTLDKAKAVVEAAEWDPVKFGGVLRRMDESGNVDAAYKTTLFESTQRLMAAPEIFVTTIIGRVPLAEYSASELRWLAGFFAALGLQIEQAPNGATSAANLFTVGQVKRAIAKAER